MKFRGVICAFSLLVAVACGGGSATDNVRDDCENNCAECNCDDCMEDGVCEKTGQNAVIENIMSRRSVRNYKQQAIPRDVLKTIMECGINAPNALNKQSWEVRVVDNPAFQNEIKEVMAATGNERAAGCFYNAPVWVLIARDAQFPFSSIDCGLLAENIMLSANSLGVGSVCLGSPVPAILNSPDKDKVLGKLGFSEGYELCVCISIGYAEETPAAKPRDFNKVKFVD